MTLGELIEATLDDGFDIIVRVSATHDGKPGKLNIPTSWGERLDLDDYELRRLSMTENSK